MTMTIEQAIRILDQETSAEEIRKLEYIAGFNRQKVVDSVQAAMDMGIEAMKKQIPKKPKRYKLFDNSTIEYCGTCEVRLLLPGDAYCSICGQKIDWGDENETVHGGNCR